MSEEIQLVLAAEQDAEVIHEMKYEAFLPLYEKYQDDETSPVKETKENLLMKMRQEGSDYYLIKCREENAGAVRVVERGEGIFYISPVFVLPQYQNRGIGGAVIQTLFQKYPQAVTWRLDTILQEAGNCHLYEKCGFVRTGKEKPVNAQMTLVDYEKTMVDVRRFEDRDAEAVAKLMHRNFREVNIKDYGEEAIEAILKSHDAAHVRYVASYAHMYVFCRGEEIVGVGSITSYWGSEIESILLTVFVLPEYHGKGIGRTIIRTLEQDELFLRAERIEIPASITAVEFYRGLGYDFKGGIRELDGEGHYRLEKFRHRDEDEVS